MTVGSGEQWLGKMTDDELEELFRAGQIRDYLQS